MHHIISFKTAKFDVSKEKENPINPIYGYSLLDWLREKTKDTIKITAPDAEDWGWYSFLKWNGRDYMIGASVHYEKGDDSIHELEWVFQVAKQRSLMEKILGKEKMANNDTCLLYFQSIFVSDPKIKEIEVD